MIALIILLLVVDFIVLTILTEKNLGGWALTTIIVSFVLYNYAIDRGAFLAVTHYIRENTASLLIFTGGYILIGIFWSFYKWWRFLLKNAYKENREYAAKAGKSMWNLPKAGDNIDRIITWMAYWPFSMAWLLISRPYTLIYNLVSDTYERIYERVKLKLERNDS